MKAAVRALSTISLVWTLLTFVLIGLMMVPVVPGAVQVQLPPPDSWVTSIEDNQVIMTNNLSIRNGGLFPFNDIYFVLELYGTDNAVLAAFNSTKTDIGPNAWTTIPVMFHVNRTAFENFRVRDMLFDQVTVGGLVYFNVRYLFDLRAQVGLNSSITLGPLIKSHFDLSRASLSQLDGNSSLVMPYYMNSSGVLYGRNLSISGTIRNETQDFGTFNQTIPLGGNGSGDLTIDLAPGTYEHLNSSSDRLTINVTVTAGDFSWNHQQERDWRPPPGG
ncbi:MAG: hypothetical protein SA339_06185 [Methanomassiliicoccus sp.]|nr:hypothetical protein [Methanomassiliicoccus sp.]